MSGEDSTAAGATPLDTDATVEVSPSKIRTRPRAIPERIGAYKILRLLGQGGMGSVYLAEQEHPRRQVALKVIRNERLSDSLLARFEQETAVLARLQHAGIAQIFEAGAADSLPYFAMEYVSGKSLTEYAAARKLGVRQRLGLLVRICEAVEHAHQKGIIHRDLKPGNILVDESGQPKILDFGIARATDADLQLATLATTAGQIVGTLHYMSPEQAQADPTRLDTRSDVYALGVIGYQLLAGKLPHDVQGRAVTEAVRMIVEEEPVPLSSLDKNLRGDLNTIIAKALEKERERRYQSAADLARDIERYLRDEPILARPASTWYQLSKFARRNRVLVGGVISVFAALVVGMIFTSAALVYAKGQESLAKSESSRARTAEEASQRDAALALASAAKLSAQHGDWKQAAAQYTEALEKGHPDEIELRIGRLQCYSALNDNRSLADEIESLSQRPDLGKFAGQVLLARAWLAEVGGSKHGDPAALRHEALEKGLPPADAAHARSFDATTVPETITHLEEAVRADPYHVTSHERLFLMYFISGRLEEAERSLARLQLLEPSGIFVFAAGAILRGMAEDAAGVEANLAEVERRGGPEEAATLRLVLGMISKARARSPLESYDVGSLMKLAYEFRSASAMIAAKLGSGASGLDAKAGVQMLNHPLLGKLVRHVFTCLGYDAIFLRSAAADEWGKVAEILPEVSVLTVHAGYLIQVGRLEEAERVLSKAIAAPDLVGNRRMAYLHLADVQWRLGTAGGKRDEKKLAEALENVRHLRRYQPLFEYELLIATRVAMEQPEPAMGYELVKEWERLAPDDSGMHNYRAAAEYRLGAYGRALITAGEKIRRDGDDADQMMSKLRALSLWRLQGRVDPSYDWLTAMDFEIKQFATAAKLSGDAADPNAAAWCEKETPGSLDSLDGLWCARTAQAATPDRWVTHQATVKAVGNRLEIEFLAPEGGVGRRIIARRDGDRLVGWQCNATVGVDSSPWVGKVVDPERIDGIFPNGRLDLRRKLSGK